MNFVTNSTPLVRTLLLVLLATASWSNAARAAELTVSAAVSLKPALAAIAPAYERATGDRLAFNFGSSGALMAQVKAGAPVDVFISAAGKQVDVLTAAGLVDPGTRRDVAGNRLVLVVPANARGGATSFDDLKNPAVKRIAVGQPKTVPAGDYAAQVLANRGLTDAVAGKLVLGANVRQVLDYVVRGEVDAGLVYATDAREAGDAVRVVATADPSWHEPIVYPGVVVTASRHAEASRRFLDHLLGRDAQRAFAETGFTPPEPAPAPVPTTGPAR